MSLLCRELASSTLQGSCLPWSVVLSFVFRLYDRGRLVTAKGLPLAHHCERNSLPSLDFVASLLMSFCLRIRSRVQCCV